MKSRIISLEVVISTTRENERLEISLIIGGYFEFRIRNCRTS